jgi:hypothetical protein
MEQYISKSALIAEIENLVDRGKYHDDYDCAYRDGNNGALYALKSKLDSLEVKETDSTDAFIEKACDFFEENIEEEDCKIGSSELVELRAEYKSLDSFIRAFVEYMKGE